MSVLQLAFQRQAVAYLSPRVILRSPFSPLPYLPQKLLPSNNECNNFTSSNQLEETSFDPH